jgi:ribonuclease HII
MADGPTLDRERSLWKAGYECVAGVDEAGRGCLAGPVVAAAVIFRRGACVDGVTDSKLLARQEREELARRIERTALAVAVGMCSPKEIDQLNILWAAMEAMRRAVARLSPAPHYLLIDGNHCFPDAAWPFETVVKGDLTCHAIAAASIVAKVTRDRYMHSLHDEYPDYSWHSNVGYPTREHYAALSEHGPTPYHRHSFRLA